MAEDLSTADEKTAGDMPKPNFPWRPIDRVWLRFKDGRPWSYCAGRDDSDFSVQAPGVEIVALADLPAPASTYREGGERAGEGYGAGTVGGVNACCMCGGATVNPLDQGEALCDHCAAREAAYAAGLVSARDAPSEAEGVSGPPPLKNNTEAYVERARERIRERRSVSLPEPEGELRSLAVEIVDAIHGFTCEFSSQPSAHRQDYDVAERILRAAAKPAQPVPEGEAVKSSLYEFVRFTRGPWVEWSMDPMSRGGVVLSVGAIPNIQRFYGTPNDAALSALSWLRNPYPRTPAPLPEPASSRPNGVEGPNKVCDSCGALGHFGPCEPTDRAGTGRVLLLRPKDSISWQEVPADYPPSKRGSYTLRWATLDSGRSVAADASAHPALSPSNPNPPDSQSEGLTKLRAQAQEWKATARRLRSPMVELSAEGRAADVGHADGLDECANDLLAEIDRLSPTTSEPDHG